MPKAVFVRSDWDLITHYMASYTTKLVDFAKQNGYEVVDLYNDDPKLPARLPAFETEMDKKPIDILYIGGHGNVNLATGQELELLIKKGVNDDVSSGVKTYLQSCLTAQQLGPALVEKGCPFYAGYREDWVMMYHPDYESKPLEDPYAKAFFDSGLATGYALLLGKSPQEVYQETIDRYNYWWDYWIKQDDPMADDILTWINWDRNNFVAITAAESYEAPPQVAGLNLPAVILPLGAAGLLLFLLSRA